MEPKEDVRTIKPKEANNQVNQDKDLSSIKLENELDKLIKPKEESTPTKEKRNNRRDHKHSKPSNRIMMTIKIPPHLAEHFRIPMNDLQLQINVLTRPQPNQ